MHALKMHVFDLAFIAKTDFFINLIVYLYAPSTFYLLSFDIKDVNCEFITHLYVQLYGL